MPWSQRVLRVLCAWLLFFLMAAGLGYPTLNRYDPRAQVPDAAIYARIANDGHPAAVDTHLRFRVLVPYLARAVWRVAKNHTGTWDPLAFSFLFVNACLVATTACLILQIGIGVLREPSVPLLAASLYVLNFAVANLHLAALVDAAEGCFLLALVASMYDKRWNLLLLWGVVGTLAKESFVPFSIVMALAWVFSSDTTNKVPARVWVCVMTATELATLVILQSAISSHLVLPWSFAASMNSPTGYAWNLWHSVADRNSWYVMIWLVPLGLLGINQMPREWRTAAGAGVVCAIVLNAYHSTVGGGGGGLGRYVFNVAGPLLSLSAAAFLVKWYSVQPAR